MIINLKNKASNQPNPEELFALQKESISTMYEYNQNLIPKLDAMSVELTENILEDSWEFLRMMVDGFNWVIEVYNSVSALINPNEELIDNSKIESSVQEFATAFRKKDASETSRLIKESIIPFLTSIQDAIEKYNN